MVNQPMSALDLDGWVVGNDGQDDSQNLGRPRTNADNSERRSSQLNRGGH